MNLQQLINVASIPNSGKFKASSRKGMSKDMSLVIVVDIMKKACDVNDARPYDCKVEKNKWGETGRKGPQPLLQNLVGLSSRRVTYNKLGA
jgi:hypothetical protein